MKKILTIIFYSIIGISILLFYFHESRSFYCFANGKKCITIWKRLGGECYIISGKYYGLGKPVDDYIVTSNLNAVTIVSDPKSKFYFIVANDYGHPVKLYSKRNRFLFYDYDNKQKFDTIYYDTNGMFILTKAEFLAIDIKENYVVINGRKVR